MNFGTIYFERGREISPIKMFNLKKTSHTTWALILLYELHNHLFEDVGHGQDADANDAVGQRHRRHHRHGGLGCKLEDEVI